MIKKILPKWLSGILRYLMSIIYAMNDYLFILKIGFTKEDIFTLEKTLTEFYHAIEKGLIKKEFRPGFGQEKIKIIMNAIIKFEKLHFSKTNMRYLTALSVLNAYAEKNKQYNIDIKYIEDFVLVRKDFLKIQMGGVKEISKISNTDLSQLTFNELASNRVSVRYFGEKFVSMDLISKSIETAMNTPSVCNRQGWFIKIIKNKELIKEVLDIQGGFNGHGYNIQYLILITTNKKYFRYPSERNQSFIDGGLFSMSLLYALTSNNIATCSLNSNLTLKKRRKLSKLIELKYEDALIMFIAVGSFPEKIITTKSIRDIYLDKLDIYE